MSRIVRHLASLLVAAASAGTASAHCIGHWLFAPQPNTDLVATVSAMGLWDPDDEGPQPLRLIAAWRGVVNGQPPQTFLASWDGAQWTAFGPAIDGWVRSISSYGGALVIAGDFTSVAGVSTNRIAQFNGTAWSTLGAGFNAEVSVVRPVGSSLYAAGAFTTLADATPMRAVSRWNGVTWSTVGAGPGGGFDAPVRTLEVFNGELYAGGEFLNTSAGTPIRSVARFDGDAWQPVGSGLIGEFPVGTPPKVTAIASFAGSLLIGGSFAGSTSGVSSPGLIRFDGNAFNAMTQTGVPNVSIIHPHFEQCLVAGSFAGFDGVTYNSVASWNGSSFRVMTTGIRSGQNPAQSILCAGSFDDEIHVGGRFNIAEDFPAFGYARWMEWRPARIELPPPDAMTICKHANVQIDTQGYGTVPMSFQWLRDGVPIADGPTEWNSIIIGATTPSLTIVRPTLGDTGTYVCVALNACATAPTDGTLLTFCPADLDDGSGSGACDGAVAIDDLIYFLSAFENGTLDADLDDGTARATPDGAVTIEDLVFMLVRFEEGC